MASKKTTTTIQKKPQVLPPEEKLLDLAEGLTKANWYMDLVEGYEIPDDDEYTVAAELAKSVATEQKLWEDQQEKATRKLKNEYDMRRATFQPVIKRLKDTKQILKDMLGAYSLRKLQEQRRLLDAANAAESPSENTQLMREARTAGAPEVKGIGGKVCYTAVLRDESLVPNEYWVVDMGAVQRAVDAGARDIPGIEVLESVNPTVRRK